MGWLGVGVRLGAGGVFAVFFELLVIWTHSSPVQKLPSTGGHGRKSNWAANLGHGASAIRDSLSGCQVELPGDDARLNQWSNNDFSTLELLGALGHAKFEWLCIFKEHFGVMSP